ncbi:MAG TPA: hypothetical protein VK636_06890 [Gemmatimonadaceae bacterium]|nr:hypothetical protein [Gemmatimonadaceae bacterium]
MESSETPQSIANPVRSIARQKLWVTPQLRVASIAKFTQLDPDVWASASVLS